MYENTYTPKLVKTVQISGTEYYVCPVCGCIASPTELQCRNCSQMIVYNEADLGKSHVLLWQEYIEKKISLNERLAALAKIYDGVYAIKAEDWVRKDVAVSPSPTTLALAASKYIHGFIVNKRMQAEDGTPLPIWWHSMPLKSWDKHYMDPDNWALPEETVTKIKIMLLELEARAIVIMNARQTLGEATKERFGMLHFLPPWIVFPLYHTSSLGWRMGYGEDYLQAYHEFLTTLTQAELAEYKATYPLPEYLEAWAPSE